MRQQSIISSSSGEPEGFIAAGLLTCALSLPSTDACCVQVVASSLDTLEPVLLEGFESKEDLVACLKASANVPRIAGEPLQHRYPIHCISCLTGKDLVTAWLSAMPFSTLWPACP